MESLQTGECYGVESTVAQAERLEKELGNKEESLQQLVAGQHMPVGPCFKPMSARKSSFLCLVCISWGSRTRCRVGLDLDLDLDMMMMLPTVSLPCRANKVEEKMGVELHSAKALDVLQSRVRTPWLTLSARSWVSKFRGSDNHVLIFERLDRPDNQLPHCLIGCQQGTVEQDMVQESVVFLFWGAWFKTSMPPTWKCNYRLHILPQVPDLLDQASSVSVERAKGKYMLPMS